MEAPKLAVSSSVLSVLLQHRAVIYSNNIPVVSVTSTVSCSVWLRPHVNTNSLYTFFSSKNVYIWSISHLQTHSTNKAVNFLHSLLLMLMKITKEEKKKKTQKMQFPQHYSHCSRRHNSVLTDLNSEMSQDLYNFLQNCFMLSASHSVHRGRTEPYGRSMQLGDNGTIFPAGTTSLLSTEHCVSLHWY